MSTLNERPTTSNEGSRLDRRLRALALSTLVATYLLIVLGSTVRVTESGMGCKGWPLCSGQIGPIDQFHPLLEQSHRYLASIVTILIAALALLCWRAGEKAYHMRGLAIAGVGVIIVQIILGAITVITNNAPATVALHLIVALIFLGIVTLTAVRAFAGTGSSWKAASELDRSSLWAVTGVFFILISGSLVVDGRAQKACPSWPVCLGSHAQGGLIDLQLIHRAVVLLGTVAVLVYLLRVIRSVSSGSQHVLAVTALVLLVVQIAAGAVVAITKAPDALADIHLALAAALWAVTVATAAVGALRRHTATMQRV